MSTKYALMYNRYIYVTQSKYSHNFFLQRETAAPPPSQHQKKLTRTKFFINMTAINFFKSPPTTHIYIALGTSLFLAGITHGFVYSCGKKLHIIYEQSNASLVLRYNYYLTFIFFNNDFLYLKYLFSQQT